MLIFERVTKRTNWPFTLKGIYLLENKNSQQQKTSNAHNNIYNAKVRMKPLKIALLGF